MYSIGISCVGGGVGQSVIGSCRLSGLPLYTVGLDTNPLAFGAYECDKYVRTSPVNSDDYIRDLIAQCKTNKIDLIIPGHDDEILLFARHAKQFKKAGIATLVSGKRLVELCRDKEKMSNILNRVADVFVTAYSKNTLRDHLDQGEDVFPLIAKPRGGSASKGIRILRDRQDLDEVDDNFILQELALPCEDDPNYDVYMQHIRKNVILQVSEISVQIVTGKDGTILGKMASHNKLKNGVPVEVIPVDDKRVWDTVDRLLPHFYELGFCGPLNLQGRITNQGFKIFEMNPRFTGISGLRALMGFNEVAACIADWLRIDTQSVTLNINPGRFGLRQTTNKVVPMDRSTQAMDVCQQIHSKPRTSDKILLLTGVDGLLGKNLVQALLSETEYTVWVIGCHIDLAEYDLGLYEKRLQIFDKIDLENGRLSLGRVDVLIHTGLTEGTDSQKELADRLAFTNRLFAAAGQFQVPAIINTSSMMIYGETEESVVAPQTSHAQTLYAAELMLEGICRIHKHIKTTSLRLATLIENIPALKSVPAGSEQSFLEAGLAVKDSITLNEVPCRLKVINTEDAISAFLSLLQVAETLWQPHYDVWSGLWVDIRRLAPMDVLSAGSVNDVQSWEDVVNKNETTVSKNGANGSSLSADTGWKPVFGREDLIHFLKNHLPALSTLTGSNTSRINQT